MIFFLLYANKFPLNFQTFDFHYHHRQEGQQKKRENIHIYIYIHYGRDQLVGYPSLLLLLLTVKNLTVFGPNYHPHHETTKFKILVANGCHIGNYSTS